MRSGSPQKPFILPLQNTYVLIQTIGETKGEGGYLKAVRASKDPTTFTVLFEDTAAILGLVVAFAGIFLGQVLDMPELDGAASIAAGYPTGTSQNDQQLTEPGLVSPDHAARVELEHVRVSITGPIYEAS